MTRPDPYRLPVPSGREADLQRFCLRYLAACRLTAWRCNVAGFKAEGRFFRSLPRGHADLQALLPDGRALFVEVKGPRGRLSPWQIAWQDQMRRAGALVLTVKSIEDLRQGLRAAGIAAP